MKRTFFMFWGVVGVICAFLSPIPMVAQTPIPLPNHAVYSSGKFLLNAKTTLFTNADAHQTERLQAAVTELLNKKMPIAKGEKSKNQLRILLTDTSVDTAKIPFERELQAYSLEVDRKGITLKARTETGLYYALQTLAAMVVGSEVPFAVIEDTPRFAYRGFMIDCSRHFWTADFIKKQIRMMARLKLNRLHLHLTDAAGWRMEIKHYPDLTRRTAFRTYSHWDEWWGSGNRQYCDEGTPGAYGGYYTQKELREIVAYAAQHHITVIPEIDMPGHSEEVTYAYPQLSCDGKTYSDLCIGTEETFRFAENVLKEVMDVFPSEYIHLGGDEAAMEHWKTCERCQKRMRDNQLGTVAELQAYMMKRINAFLNAHGRKLIGWDEMIDGGLPPHSIVMAWRSADKGAEAVKAGHHVIMSPIDWCYLNFYQDNPFTQPEAMGGYGPLKHVYTLDPIPNGLKGTPQEAYIDGVQGNLWTEYVQHADHV
ncbi:MAG TPA: beta-N-acetylhexosaminidase, partial [Prevotella sp.]